MSLYNAQIPVGWELIAENQKHPIVPFLRGDLVRNTHTGCYCLIAAGVVNTVPPRWAQEVAEKTGHNV